MHALLKGFSIVLEVPVAWGEMDAFGHVNNIIFFRYFENARIAYLERILLRGRSGDTVGPILHSTSCRFRRPLTYPDRVQVGTRATSLQADRFTMEYRIVSLGRNELAADGGSIVVAYDYASATKTMLPLDVRERIQALDGVALQAGGA